MRVPTVMIVALAGMPTPVSPAWGQRLLPHVPSAVQPFDESRDQGLRASDAPVGSVLGAIVGGAAGFLAGATVGARLGECEGDGCGLEAAFYGGFVGETLGLGVGAHLGNFARGRWWAPMAASAAVMLVSVIVADEADLPGEALILIPVTQIVVAVLAEMATAGDRATDGPATAGRDRVRR